MGGVLRQRKPVLQNVAQSGHGSSKRDEGLPGVAIVPAAVECFGDEMLWVRERVLQRCLQSAVDAIPHETRVPGDIRETRVAWWVAWLQAPHAPRVDESCLDVEGLKLWI